MAVAAADPALFQAALPPFTTPREPAQGLPQLRGELLQGEREVLLAMHLEGKIYDSVLYRLERLTDPEEQRLRLYRSL